MSMNHDEFEFSSRRILHGTSVDDVHPTRRILLHGMGNLGQKACSASGVELQLGAYETSDPNLPNLMPYSHASAVRI